MCWLVSGLLGVRSCTVGSGMVVPGIRSGAGAEDFKFDHIILDYLAVCRGDVELFPPGKLLNKAGPDTRPKARKRYPPS